MILPTAEELDSLSLVELKKFKKLVKEAWCRRLGEEFEIGQDVQIRLSRRGLINCTVDKLDGPHAIVVDEAGKKYKVPISAVRVKKPNP